MQSLAFFGQAIFFPLVAGAAATLVVERLLEPAPALKGRPWRSLSDVIAGHMESVGTRAYTRAELRERFAGLEELRVEHVSTAYDRMFAGPLARLTGDRLGWFLVVRGRAPSR